MSDDMASWQKPRRPRISVITTNKNGARYLRATIESVLSQDFTDYEHIIVDGASTDTSLDIIKSYPHLRWVSERDSSPNDGFRKGFEMARGDYLMVMCVSDIYLSKSWFRRCVETLESDREASLVWGLSVEMNDADDINGVWLPHFIDAPPPQKQAFLTLWLATGLLFPELNYCVRRQIFLANFPVEQKDDVVAEYNPFVGFIYNFNVNGYLARFLPLIAHCGRSHEGQHGQVIAPKAKLANDEYHRRIKEYRRALTRGIRTHVFRDSESRPLGKISKVQALFLPLHCAARKLSFQLEQIINLGMVLKRLRRLLG
jgi:glycosyltransferase involved in cell wall biosynthesis